jgi:hypothetical protein
VDDIRLFYENDLRFLEQFGLGPGGIDGLAPGDGGAATGPTPGPGEGDRP